jgi:hypothetical protein
MSVEVSLSITVDSPTWQVTDCVSNASIYIVGLRKYQLEAGDLQCRYTNEQVMLRCVGLEGRAENCS